MVAIYEAESSGSGALIFARASFSSQSFSVSAPFEVPKPDEISSYASDAPIEAIAKSVD
ncbi:hypothetical protein [Arthrobacter sp. ES3-54]|jgi:hypothetical protein|uniref:hypothetical protein n=1 Tax=Arthrobacter sp. ES3-54 TaxID=1502991 RepID=UPI0024054A32|nr:hypothetical protein [Arthrobacter sp. ES3-54]MDF9751384.1 hypothetical protein [Arthrobacter sp. ES3-54]